MAPEKPQTAKEGKQYCGRQVSKAFYAGGAKGRKRFFKGVVVDCPKFHGEICYTIEYEDGDSEDIAWEELVQIMLPDASAQVPSMSNQGGLTDATNRSLAPRDKASDTPLGVQPAKKARGRGLITPPTDEEASQPASGAQQPQVPRQVRTRLRHVNSAELGADGEQDGGDAARGPVQQQPSRVRKRLQPDPPQEGEGVDDGGAPEHLQQEPEPQQREQRPRKRRAREQAEPEEPPEEQQHEETPDEQEEPASAEFPRKVGAAGHLARIHLENFMCHQNFELDIGTHVTLVSGTNGSGKSAVMQALQVCLGATARETGRGTSLTGFIRTGALEAKVQVTLWNTGEEAFMPDTFGNRITVERVLKKCAGSSPFNLLDYRMRKANLNGERPREVLERMLDHFALDASNPLCIITQDMARQFLSANKDDAAKKYEIFMQSTLMDKTQYNIKAANADLSTIMQRYNETATAYNEAKKEQAELRSRVEKLKSADKLVQDRDMLEKAAVWRAVQQAEQKLEVGRVAAETNGPKLLALYDRQLAAFDKGLAELEERKKELEEQLVNHQSAMNNRTEQAKSLIEAQRKAKVELERAKRGRTCLQTAMETLVRDREDLNKKLEEDNSGQAAEARRLCEEHQQKVTAKQAELQAATEAVTAANQALEAARNELHELSRQEQAARNNVHKFDTMVRKIREGLQQLAASQGNRLALFKAVDLNRLIDQNARRFKRRPIGPIGAYLTVTERKWLLAADVATGQVLRDYLVCCSEDAVLLRQLMQQARYPRASVVTVAFTDYVYEIPDVRRPDNGYCSVLDVIRVQDAAARCPVINYLVDKLHLESIALAEIPNVARAVVWENRAGAHITLAMDAEGVWYRRNGNFRWQERPSKKREQCTLVADVSEYMASMARDLEQYEAQLGASREEQAAQVTGLEEARVRAGQCEQQLKYAMAQKTRVTTELQRLVKSAPELPNTEQDEEASIVLTQLASIQTELAESQMNLQLADEKVGIAEQAFEDLKRQTAEATQRYEEQSAAGSRLREKQVELRGQTDEMKSNRAMAVDNRGKLERRLAQLQQGVAGAAAKLEASLALAEQVCSREEGEEALEAALVFAKEVASKVNNRRQQRDAAAVPDSEAARQQLFDATVASIMDCMGLERQLQKVTQAIQKVQSDVGTNNLEELEIKLADKDKLVEIRLAAHRRIERLWVSFQTAYTNQVRLFDQRRTSIEEITVSKFRKYLMRRGHMGRLLWDHKERSLKVFVQPGGKNKKDAQWVEDLKSLSGGERSFTTVAFLLAVGLNIESPFRCMDEYDVFMDAVNRRIATETLLEFALDNNQYQYIFLTPQDIQAVEEARKVLAGKRGIELPPEFLKTVQLRPARQQNAGAQ